MLRGPNVGGPLLIGPPPTFGGGAGGPVVKGEDAKGPGRGPVGPTGAEEGEGPEVIGLEADVGGALLLGVPPPPVGRLAAMKGGIEACGGPLDGGPAPLGTTPGGGGPGRLGPEKGDDEYGPEEGNGWGWDWGCGWGCCPNGGGGPLGPLPGYGG